MTQYFIHLQQWPDNQHRGNKMCVELWNNGAETPSGLKVRIEISCGQNTVFALNML